jgi:hypothetical protein
MIRTATGIALLILIAVYGILYMKRESFTSTINFVNVIDTFNKMTPEDKEKITVMWNTLEEDKQFDNALKSKILEREELIELLNKSYNAFSKVFESLAFKYNLDTVDIYSLLIYVGKSLVDKSTLSNIEEQNLNQLQFIVPLWSPPGRSPSTAQPTLNQAGYLTSNTASPSANVASALIAATASPSITSTASGSTASGSTASGSSASTVTSTVRDAVREELRLAGLVAGSTKPTVTNANFAYGSGVIQKAQPSSCAKNWCTRCRSPANTCGCQRF